MYRKEHEALLRSEWSEYSLRVRPNKVTKFQVGLEAPSKTDDTSAGHKMQTKYMLRYGQIAEDSIEHDACKCFVWFQF